MQIIITALIIMWIILLGAFIPISAVILLKMGEFVLGKHFKKIYFGIMTILIVLTIFVWSI